MRNKVAALPPVALALAFLALAATRTLAQGQVPDLPLHAVSDQRPVVAAGRVEPHTIRSAAYGRERRYAVYTPPGYSPARTYPLLIAFDGSDYLDTAVLDSLLAAGKAPPMVAVLVDDSTAGVRLDDLANHERFVRFLTGELLPAVRARYRVTTDPPRTVVAGSSAGGLAAAYVALQRPDLFGNVLSQSGAFWRGNEGASAPVEWLTGRYAALPRKPIRFVLDVGDQETRATAGGGPSILDANRRLHAVLVKKGYDVRYTEVPGGVHAPETWRPRFPGDLEQLVSEWKP